MKTHKEMMQSLLNGDTLVNESKQDIKLHDNGMIQMFTAQGKYETIITFKPKNWELKKMKNEKLEQLLKQKQDIEDQIKNLQQKWQPVGGKYCIFSHGEVGLVQDTTKEYRLFGKERQTQKQAEKARDKMRVFNRLLAYHDEFCHDYEFIEGNDNYYIYYNNDVNKYFTSFNTRDIVIGFVFFPEHIAKELVEKLNSGDVEL